MTTDNICVHLFLICANLCNKKYVTMNAVIFPGQGAQYPRMGKDLYDNFPEVRDIFSRIDKAAGMPLSEKCFYASEEELKDTSLQQLTILTVSLAAFEVFRGKSIKIDYFSGLSLGEYSCLYPAGVLSLEDVVILIRERSLAMDEAAKENPSCMFAVIGAREDDLKGKQNNSFYIANINSPSQIVVSLAENKKLIVKEILTKSGFRVVELDVSGGFHSTFMEPARVRLKKVMESLNFLDAKVPIVSNFTARAHTDREDIKHNLINQLTHPVLWKDCIEFMNNKGVNTFFEVGPSRVLKGILRKINPQLKVVNIGKKEDIDVLE